MVNDVLSRTDGQQEYHKAAAQALDELMLGVIGENVPVIPINQLSDEDLVIQLQENACNVLRQSLRSIIKGGE